MNSADIAAKYQKTYFMPPEVTYDLSLIHISEPTRH